MSKEVTDKQIQKALDKADGNKSEAARALGITRNQLRYRLRDASLVSRKEELTQVEEHRLKRELRSTKAELRDVAERYDKVKQQLDLSGLFAKMPLSVPKFLHPKHTKRSESGIITALLSDLHLDEVVQPEQINYVNGYNRAIATQRLKNFFTNLVELSTDYINGIRIEGLTMPMLGDMVGGIIHEELKETNESVITETIIYWAAELASGIEYLAKHFNWIYIPCVVGNHGRLTHKPRHKYRAQDNFDFLLYHYVTTYFRGVKEIVFHISDAADLRYPVYSTNYQITHGDQFRGGSGIAGMMSPLLLGSHRKQKRESAVGTPFDYLLMGHWHQLAHFKGVIVNGSLKGYDEYAYTNNFDFEPPQQAFWITDPKWGKTMQAPIHVLDKNESWRK